jgi:hypothetical protein
MLWLLQQQQQQRQQQQQQQPTLQVIAWVLFNCAFVTAEVV